MRRALIRLRQRLSPGMRRVAVTRRSLAERYLRGEGIEIGALHMPLALPRAARARYVDRSDLVGLRRHYPELEGETLVAPDVVDDGETLASITDGSLDFIVANHFLEHCEDPIGTLENHLRALRPGGILYLAIPDRTSGVDVERPLTTDEHLIGDHTHGPASSREEHYREWSELVDLRLGNVEPALALGHAHALAARRYSIHFHVWDASSFASFIHVARRRFGLPLHVEEIVPNAHEFIAILSRAAAR